MNRSLNKAPGYRRDKPSTTILNGVSLHRDNDKTDGICLSWRQLHPPDCSMQLSRQMTFFVIVKDPLAS